MIKFIVVTSSDIDQTKEYSSLGLNLVLGLFIVTDNYLQTLQIN